jgi:hypothetical protein
MIYEILTLIVAILFAKIFFKSCILFLDVLGIAIVSSRDS